MGARLIKTQGGNGYTGKVYTYAVAAGHSTLIAPGDFVSATGTGTTKGVPYVDATAAAGLISGVVTSVNPNFSNLEQKGLPASTAGTLQVEVDPMALYEIPISGAALAVTDIESNADILATAATSSGGAARSNMTLNGSAVVASGATGQLRIVGLKEDPDGVLALGAVGNIAIVRINESYVKGVVGV